ncbi:hypothetical protein PAXRUDRAFT_176954 [Paxillus rubicundulus Ve08.2h10]|uniref:Uncharacterized protein n=1 Tax=Paxillus rubicundulus Ve08.2h10 TaxID=930991 RepID=A0A0D0D298_9AGAM|nr:hypothetical protein PAXRUDRAFT_176954 [Paxillus rubicundulus Ve08.2h10]
MNIPSHWQLCMSNIIAEYMVNQFLETIGQPTRPTLALPNTSIPLSAVCEADQIALGLNEIGTNEAREKALKERFPVEKDEELVCEPTLLLDQTGVIIAWHLPGVLSEEFQVDCVRNLEFLFPDISRSITSSRSWRTQEDLFTESQIRGAIELPPAWYQKGQVVRQILVHHVEQILTLIALQAPAQAGALKNAILSATLMVMDPDIYASGRETFLKVAGSTQDEDMQQIIPEWPTVYLVVLVIANWVTPFHGDLSFQVQWLDLLATIGGDPDLHIELENLGVRLAYSPGTVVGLSREVLQHGVLASVLDQAFLAYHMRDNVQEGVGVHRCDWVKQGELPILLQRFALSMTN